MDWKSKSFKPVFQGLIILLIGLAGGILFDRLGISAGFFMGCMLFSGFYRFVVKSEIALTGIYNQLGQIIFGMLIGTSFRQENLETMKLATLPILFQIIVLVSAGFLMGMLLSRLTPLDRDDQSGGGFEAECRNRSGGALFPLNDYRPDHALADAFSWPA